jgi:hypothetical protein
LFVQDFFEMKSSIVRGMPYATMVYSLLEDGQDELYILPTVYSEIGLSELPVVDGAEQTGYTDGTSFTVQREVELVFESGLKWVVFFSQPVTAECLGEGEGGPFLLQVVSTVGATEAPLVVRLAMVVPSANEEVDKADFAARYGNLLRSHASVYPGEATSVYYSVESNKAHACLTFDWDAKTMDEDREVDTELLTFAMPHHQDKLDTEQDLCTASLTGPVCLTKGSSWNLVEVLPEVSFQAPRHPNPRFLPDLADAVTQDLNYAIPANYLIGAGDTYFSGKALAKLARIILVAQELKDLCASAQRQMQAPGSLKARTDDYRKACNESNIPDEETISPALDQLRRAVEVWIGGNTQSPFVYDSAWGGFGNCGCSYQDGTCSNTFPNCPAFTDQLLNFGHGGFNAETRIFAAQVECI